MGFNSGFKGLIKLWYGDLQFQVPLRSNSSQQPKH